MRRLLTHALPLAGAILAFAALNLWASRWDARFDLTSAGVYSLSQETEQLLDSLRVPVDVTFFYDSANRSTRDALALLERMARRTARLRVRGIDPIFEPAAAQSEGVRFAGTSVFRSEGRRLVVHGGTETEFVNGLIRVTRGGARRICFSDGHVESDAHSLESHDHSEAGGHGHDHSQGGRPLRIHERHGAGMARRGLETLGFEVEKRTLLGVDALSGCSVLVVASPQVPFEADERGRVRAFLEAGGAAVFLLEPMVSTGLGPLLAAFGLELDLRPVRDPRHHYGTDSGSPAVSRYPHHRITRDLPLTFFPGAASVRPPPEGAPRGVVVTPLVQTSAGALSEAGESQGRRTLAVHAVRTAPDGVRSEVVVVGDGDFATNSFFPILGNGKFFLQIVNALAASEDLVAIAPRHYRAPSIELTNVQMRVTFLLSTLLLPGLLAGAGVFLWWRGR